MAKTGSVQKPLENMVPVPTSEFIKYAEDIKITPRWFNNGEVAIIVRNCAKHPHLTHDVRRILFSKMIEKNPRRAVALEIERHLDSGRYIPENVRARAYALAMNGSFASAREYIESKIRSAVAIKPKASRIGKLQPKKLK